MNPDQQILSSLYGTAFGAAPTAITPLPAAASPRRYFRISGPVTVIGTIGRNRRENEAFIYLARTFESHGLPVPHILVVSDDALAYLQTDLGDTAIFPALKPEWLEEAMNLLPRFQAVTDLDLTKLYPRPAMDLRAIMWDLNYFKYEFLLPSGVTFDEDALEEDFSRLANSLLPDRKALMLRDFQSRNVMVRPDGSLALIDFQGARLGDPLYDVASFLWQARAGIAPEERLRLAEIYFAAAGRTPDIPRLLLFALFRTMQVLGAYGFRGLVEGKVKFVESIPQAVSNLRELLPQAAPYPELARVLQALVLEWEARFPAPSRSLTVRIFSFGFRKSGPPRDLSGNGGGFVFDCRALPNPGRLDEFKSLTGHNEPVANYLRGFQEPERFLEHALAMVGASVDRYLQRGFTSLQVAFGCTGGQHRSVYCAEQAARRLKAKFPQAEFIVTHIEQPQIPAWTL